MVAASLWLLSHIKGYQAVLSLTHLMVLLFKRKQRIFSSPISRNAPIFATSLTVSTAVSPTYSFGRLVVAMKERSWESLYTNTSRLSPTFVPSGTCFSAKLQSSYRLSSRQDTLRILFSL